MLRYHNVRKDETYNGRIQELFDKEKNISDYKRWTPLMHMCDRSKKETTRCLEISHFLRNFPELLENPGDP